MLMVAICQTDNWTNVNTGSFILVLITTISSYIICHRINMYTHTHACTHTCTHILLNRYKRPKRVAAEFQEVSEADRKKLSRLYTDKIRTPH